MFTHEPETYSAKHDNSQMLVMLRCEFCLHSTIRYSRENFNTHHGCMKIILLAYRGS